jgi:hypothetical protein
MSTAQQRLGKGNSPLEEEMQFVQLPQSQDVETISAAKKRR